MDELALKAQMTWFERRAASRRWRKINRDARVAGCRCGRPATEVRLDDRVAGNVPCETWSCADHVGVTAWIGSIGSMMACFPRAEPCAECDDFCPRSGRIGGPIDTWHCPKVRL